MKLGKLISIRLLEGQDERIQDVAQKEGLSKSDVYRRAVRLYLDGLDKAEASKS